MRLFIAADLPPELRAGLAAIRKELEGIPMPMRWVRPEGIHLTLRFLGEVSHERCDTIRRTLGAGVGCDVDPFELEAEGVGTFPESGRPRVLWVGIRGDMDAARRLKQRIDAALETIGFPPEGRDLKPHLTLGRVKGAARGDYHSYLTRLKSVRGGRFEVRQYVLFESRLAPGGATYRPLASFDLRAGATR